jgi:hypothetical protein
VIVSTHLHEKRIDSEALSLPPQVELAKPFGLFDYVMLQTHARTCRQRDDHRGIVDSQLSAPNIRQAHERLRQRKAP